MEIVCEAGANIGAADRPSPGFVVQLPWMWWMKIVVTFGRKGAKPLEGRAELLQHVRLRRVRRHHLLFPFDLCVGRLQKKFAAIGIPKFLVFLAPQGPMVKRYLPRRDPSLSGQLTHQEIAAVVIRMPAFIRGSDQRLG